MAALVAAFAALWQPDLLLFVSLPILLTFPVLVVLHQRVDARRDDLEDSAIIAREEEERRREQPTGREAPESAPPTAALPPDASHYHLDEMTAEDIGLIRGPRSIYRMINTTSTPFGAWRLVEVLTHPLVAVDRIHARQQAVRELADNDPGRRALLRRSLRLRRVPLDKLARGLRESFEFVDSHGLQRTAQLLGTLLPIAVVATFFRLEMLPAALFLGLVNLMLVSGRSSSTNPARDRLCLLGPVCRALLAIDEELSDVDPESEEWRTTHAALSQRRDVIQRLERRIRHLEWHTFGVVFEVFNVLTLWELRILPTAERLVDEHRADLDEAIGAFGQVEALLSLSALAAERADFTWPEVVAADAPFVRADEIGHPSIPADERVTNPLSMGDDIASTMVVTGSNMAGKSTYLRTIGVNVVLATIGAPVCGRGFQTTPLRLYSDVNIRDSLDDGKSYFQVEVERVRTAVSGAEQDPFCLTIFDELFRGTNAHERFAISWSLVEYVTERGALLLLATHDDRLAAEIEESTDPKLRNVHFEEQVDGGQLSFDYQLRSGPATTRNAIRVLEVTDYPKAITERARDIADPDR